MKKSCYFKKLLSVLLMAAMLVGMVNMPAQAADVTYTDVTVTSFYTNGGDWYVPQLHTNGNWRFYLTLSSKVTNLHGTYWLVMNNGEKDITVPFYAAGDTDFYTVGIPADFIDGCMAQTITIKAGQYQAENQTIGINLTEDFVFYVNAYSWSINKNDVTSDPTQKVTLSIDHPEGTNERSLGFYLQANFNDNAAKTDSDWSINYDMKTLTAVNGTSFYMGGIYAGADRLAGRLIKYTDTGYWVEVGTATEGTEYTVKGLFQDYNGKVIAYLPVTVTWDGEKWTEKDLGVLESYESMLEIDDFWRDSGTNAVILHGSDDYIMDASFSSSAGSYQGYNQLTPKTGDGGIYINDELAEKLVLWKLNADHPGVYYITGLNQYSIKAGDVVTVKGDFYTNGGKTKITYKERSFIYDTNKYDQGGSGWVNFYESTLEMKNRGWFDGGDYTEQNTCIYVHGIDSYLEDTDAPSDVSHLKAADSDSQIMLGNTVISSYEFFKQYGGQHTGTEDIWYLNGFEAQTGDILTIQGTFETEDKKIQIHFAKVQFQWTGTVWKDYEPPKDMNTTLSFYFSVGNSWYDPTLTERGWRVYLQPSTALAGNADDGYAVTATNGTDTRTLSLYQANADGTQFYTFIPKTFIDGTKEQTITIKKGLYKAVRGDARQDFGINLTQDFVFYVNEYGWTAENEPIKPDFGQQVVFSFDENSSKNSGADGFYLRTNANDPVTPDSDTWQSRISPLAVTSTTYYSGGVWKNGKRTEVELCKLSEDQYYVALKDKGQSATAVGDTYVVKGLFAEKEGRTIGFYSITVKWNGSGWEWVYVGLDDSGVQYDVNADGKLASSDVVSLLRYCADNTHAVNLTGADINYDGKVNDADIGSLRRVIVGQISYDTDGTVSGIPTYTTKRTFEKMAYVCPALGTWEDENTYEPYVQEKADAILQQYKEAGFTLINGERVATYEDYDFTHEVNEPLRVYLKAAERNGLGVLVYDTVIHYMLSQKNPAVYGEAWQSVLENHIQNLQEYSDAFKGFVLWDELNIGYAETYNQIISYIHEKHPELLLRTSSLPVTVYDQEGEGKGPGALTTNSEHQTSKEDAYKDYISAYVEENPFFTYDLYPLVYSEDKIFGITVKSEYGVVDDWYDNLKYTAAERKVQNYAFDTGVTIQACQLSGWSNKSSSYETYAPETKQDIGFQAYTAMAYGFSEIHYFNYEKHWSASNVLSGMVNSDGKPNDVYTAVQTVNRQIDKFANVYQSFSWRDTQDIAAGKSAASFETDNGRLSAASVTGARTLIGHMVDTDRFDGYMIANAEGPRTTTAATVSLSFNDATRVIVYDFGSGTREIKELNNGALTVSVAVGNGMLVIPLR